jgi:hypothetical protein
MPELEWTVATAEGSVPATAVGETTLVALAAMSPLRAVAAAVPRGSRAETKETPRRMFLWVVLGVKGGPGRESQGPPIRLIQGAQWTHWQERRKGK